mgnify:FL=1
MAHPNSMTLIINTTIDPATQSEGVPSGFMPAEASQAEPVTRVPGQDVQDEDPPEVVETTSFVQAQDLLEENIDRLAQARNKPMKPVTVLIDGPSGAGKTWFAARLAEHMGWQTVHLDEFYPGWHGLQKGSEMVNSQVLRKMNPGFWRWDWNAHAPAEWFSLDGRDNLIVEGVGAISADNIAAAYKRGSVVTVMVTGPREARRTRALDRDEGYEDWFETWESQEAEHFANLLETDLKPDLLWQWQYAAS